MNSRFVQRVVVLVGCGLFAGAVSALVVPAGTTFRLGASMKDPLNALTTTIDLKPGATLALTNVPGSAAGAIQLTCKIVATDGQAYLDLTEAGISGRYLVSGSIRCGAGGSLTVKGGEGLAFGRRLDVSEANFPLLDAAGLVFETAGASLLLTNSVTLCALPSAGSVAVAPGALLALRGSNPLSPLPVWDASAGAHGTLSLSDFDVMLLEDECLPQGATVRIGAGRTVYARPCGVGADPYTWSGRSGTNRLDVVVEKGGTFDVMTVNSYALEGALSGAGVFRKSLGQLKGATGCAAHVGSLTDFTGEVRMAGIENRQGANPAGLRFSSCGSGATIDRIVFDGSYASVCFDTATDVVRVAHVEGAAGSHDTWLKAENGAAVTVGTVRGSAPTFGGTVTVGACDAYSADSVVRLGGGSMRLNASVAVDSSSVLLWLDASAASSYQSLTNNGAACVFTNDFRLVDEWHDCRQAQTTVFLRNNRAYTSDMKVYERLYPYVVPAGLNGLDYLCFGKYQGTVTGGTEARRLHVWANGVETNLSNACFAIFVFGCPMGGGRSVLGSTSAAFRRSDGRENPILETDYYDLWVDGQKAASPKATYFTSDWHVLSLDLREAGVCALGQFNETVSHQGGQCYAEVLLFDRKPTDAQRISTERYLARKWGLLAAYRDANIRSGARLEGTGSVTLASDAEITGTFHGSLDLNGYALYVPDETPPPTAADVPSEGRVLWTDPDLSVAVRTNAATRPLSVTALYPRNAEGLLTTAGSLCFASTVDGANDRRPSISRSVRGFGPVRTWLDFADAYTPDSLRNALRVRSLVSSGGQTSVGTTDTAFSWRTGFIVLDTSRGGGAPVLDAIQANGNIRSRAVADVNDPVWSSKNTGSGLNLNNGKTYLDGRAVDGAKEGFSGRPELLSFEATEALTSTFFMGNINGANQEIVAETILFDRALESVDRQKVEAYLMNKWLGTTAAPYGDLTRATVVGAGRVVASGRTRLPKLGSGFTGEVALTNATVSFTIAGTYQEPDVDTFSTAGDVILSANAVDVHVPARLKAGTYPLIACRSLVCGELELNLIGNCRCGSARLVVRENGLDLAVDPSGLILVFR